LSTKIIKKDFDQSKIHPLSNNFLACRMNTDIKITKKQKLAMILMGVTATLTQGARVQGSLPQPIERYLPQLLLRITLL